MRLYRRITAAAVRGVGGIACLYVPHLHKKKKEVQKRRDSGDEKQQKRERIKEEQYREGQDKKVKM